MIIFLFLVVAAIVPGVIGVLAHGLLFPLITGIVLFVAGLAHLALRGRRSGRRPPRHPSGLAARATGACLGRFVG